MRARARALLHEYGSYIRIAFVHTQYIAWNTFWRRMPVGVHAKRKTVKVVCSPMAEHLVECTLGLSPLPWRRKVPVMNQKLLLTLN